MSDGTDVGSNQESKAAKIQHALGRLNSCVERLVDLNNDLSGGDPREDEKAESTVKVTPTITDLLDSIIVTSIDDIVERIDRVRNEMRAKLF